MVHWLLLVLAAAALKYTLGDRVIYEAKYFAILRVNPLWGDLGVALMLILVMAVAAVTYRYIEAPWRSFGRAIALRAQTELVARPI